MSVSHTINDGWKESYRCKSTDMKPVENVPNMSTLWCPDTNVVWWFDGDTKTWYEVGQGG